MNMLLYKRSNLTKRGRF